MPQLDFSSPMIQFFPGSQVWQLITVLSLVGEYPNSQRQLLGDKENLRLLINKALQTQTYRNRLTGDTMTCKLLTVSGKGVSKTIRFFKGALPILTWLHPDAYEHYMEITRNHTFPGSIKNKDRNHRIAEVLAMCMRAGIEARPYLLPKFQFEKLAPVRLSEASMYLSKDLKKLGEMEFNKTMFTRMVGALFTGNNCYATYNTRNAVMKWSGGGEIKTCQSLTDIARLNAGVRDVTSAILFGQSEDIALKTLLESDTSPRAENRFDNIYRRVHFIPMNEFGIQQLRFLSVPDWNEQLLDILFDPEERSYNRGAFEYDAYIDGVYIYSHLDSDIARLIRFKPYAVSHSKSCEVLCFHHQMPFLRKYLGQDVKLKLIDINSVEDELGPERRNLFER